MGTREYHRRIYKGLFDGNKEDGKETFIEHMTTRDTWLFKHEIWKPKTFTKRYYQIQHELAPLCLGGCGRKVLEYSSWGERNPFHDTCNQCSKKMLNVE